MTVHGGPGKGHHPRWGRIIRGDYDTVSSNEILRFLYPAGRWQEHPAWARIAYRRRWISYKQYREAKPWPDAPWHGGVLEQLYRPSPFYALLKKDTGFYDSLVDK